MKDRNTKIWECLFFLTSVIFGFIFTSSIQDMEVKLLPGTDASKILCWKIFFNENTGQFWAILSVIIIASVKDKVSNYAEIYP